MIKKVQFILASVAVSAGVAVTYHYFEAAVRNSTTYLWTDLVNTNAERWLIIPLCLLLTVIYFGAQHILDRRSETHSSHGLGDTPTASPTNFLKVLGIGFLSLVAGASLGPEAILVPACTMLGAYAGIKLFTGDAKAPKILSMVGFVALFAAFFSSFVAGMLGLLLVIKQSNAKITNGLIVLAAIASATTVGVLKLLSSGEYLAIPGHDSTSSFSTALVLVGLAIVGLSIPYIFRYSGQFFSAVRQTAHARHWVLQAVFASLGLSLLYIIGGPLVQFTGNQSVAPMFDQASQLGLSGLLWLVLVKLVAISWSKNLGYRGGLIFPTVFVASVLVAIAQIAVPGVDIGWGIIAVMVGVIAADSRTKILF